MEAEAEILSEKRGPVGLVTLNRPQALNALTLGMVREMRRVLEAWDADPDVTRIVVKGAGEKAFCAGGDIRRLTELGLAGQTQEALAFWREEYQLNAIIKDYPEAVHLAHRRHRHGRRRRSVAPRPLPRRWRALPVCHAGGRQSGSFPMWAPLTRCPGCRVAWAAISRSPGSGSNAPTA